MNRDEYAGPGNGLIPPAALIVLPNPPTDCGGCGRCCQGIGSPVLLYADQPYYRGDHPFRPRDLPQSLIAELNDAFSGLTRGQEPQAACLWYDSATRACRHYEFRPQLCRDYELGARACLKLRSTPRPEPAP